MRTCLWLPAQNYTTNVKVLENEQLVIFVFDVNTTHDVINFLVSEFNFLFQALHLPLPTPDIACIPLVGAASCYYALEQNNTQIGAKETLHFLTVKLSNKTCLESASFEMADDIVIVSAVRTPIGKLIW